MMSHAKHLQLRCPVCTHRLFDGFWVATVLEIRVVCSCKRLIQVNKDYSAEVVHEYVRQGTKQDA